MRTLKEGDRVRIIPIKGMVFDPLGGMTGVVVESFRPMVGALVRLDKRLPPAMRRTDVPNPKRDVMVWPIDCEPIEEGEAR